MRFSVSEHGFCPALRERQDKWQISGATLQIWARVLRSGSGCRVVFTGQPAASFYPVVDVSEKADGFIQAQMKDDKQADAFPGIRLSEFIPETRVQNSLLITLDGRAPTSFHSTPLGAAAESSTSSLRWSLVTGCERLH